MSGPNSAAPITPAARLEAEQELQRHLESITNAMAVITKEKKIVDRMNGHHHFKYKITKIPSEIYLNEASDQPNDPLSKLDNDAMYRIFQSLPLDADRAALALTCKRHADTYELLKEKKWTVTVDGVKKREYYLPRPQRVTDIHRLQVLVRVNKGFMNPEGKWRLCYNCNQLIDTTHPDNQGTWGGDRADPSVENAGATKRARIRGPRCPLCVRADQLQLANHRAEFAQFKRLAKGITMKETA
ncbi:hypothetical protein PV08_07512 [Exophiala spinifera]|uniref:F-box domain-containing protein n=1 Tax=Exophiala spinifera TaxID=91928 RepID=A0A0D2B714_9EURO|nr:uncharacterized protein PV08_07512 [Exophiala spinifera]KIW14728.1 hypothetical protein PV08_07512 [Exophiala spinifera]